MYKEDGQEYGQVLRMLGNGRLEAQCIDGKKRLCHIRGKMRKKVRALEADACMVPGAWATGEQPWECNSFKVFVLPCRFGSARVTSCWWVYVTTRMRRQTLS